MHLFVYQITLKASNIFAQLHKAGNSGYFVVTDGSYWLCNVKKLHCHFGLAFCLQDSVLHIETRPIKPAALPALLATSSACFHHRIGGI